ncbi:tetratricopeptide repeat protein [Reinekea sp.]|jgi:tetratricopeptide (TPR) repeat protein|uniref:tetratricopeptide repeat protein n=1 Tax=Reinekea sp. TaxID=1970455 RepID=UPI003988F7CF
MKALYIVLASSMLTFLATPALAWDNDDIDAAWRANDLDSLRALAQGEGFSALYSHYRIALIAQEQGDKKLAKKSLDIITDQLEDNYQNADEAALYYNSVGLTIALKPWTAAFAIKKATQALEYSEALTPNHAPTLVANAVGLLNRPAFAGGDKDQALIYFEQALARYQQQEAWGYEDALLWRIKALDATDKTELAVEQLKLLQQKYPNFVAAQELTL